MYNLVIIIGNWVKMIKLFKIFTFGTNIERCCETDTGSNKTSKCLDA